MKQVNRNTMEPNEFCLDLIRKHDHDRYLTTLYAPENRRAALASLYAFNYEISRVRESVSDPMLGEIKIAWWRESIAEIYENKTKEHDILKSLSPAIHHYKLPLEVFNQILDQRGTDLYDELPKTYDALESYFDATAGSLLKLACHILGADVKAGHIKYLALIWGYVGHARAIPYHLSLRKKYIPLELLEQEGFDGNIGPGPDQLEQVQNIVKIFGKRAQKSLDLLHAERKNIPQAARSAFLLAPLARSYLKTMAKADYNPFQLHEKQDEMFRQWKLFTSVLFNRL